MECTGAVLILFPRAIEKAVGKEQASKQQAMDARASMGGAGVAVCVYVNGKKMPPAHARVDLGIEDVHRRALNRFLGDLTVS